jgi:hypothetical protein
LLGIGLFNIKLNPLVAMVLAAALLAGRLFVISESSPMCTWH